MRNVLAVILAAVAALCGGGSWAGYVMDKTLTQPETVQTALGPLIHERGVQDMVATQVRDQIVKRLPGGVIQAKLKPAVDVAAKRATKAVLNDPSVDKAWRQVLDRTRAGYTEQVRSGEAGAGHIEMVLDPVGDLIAEKVTIAMSKVGVKIKDLPHARWRLSEDLSDLSPLMSLATPVLSLTVTQSEHWVLYGLIGAGSLILALLVAKRRSIVFVTAGFVALAGGLVGTGGAGIANNALKNNGNAVVRGIAQVFTDRVHSASLPVTVVGAVVMVVGIVAMIVTGSRRRRRAAAQAAADREQSAFDRERFDNDQYDGNQYYGNQYDWGQDDWESEDDRSDWGNAGEGAVDRDVTDPGGRAGERPRRPEAHTQQLPVVEQRPDEERPRD